MTTRKKFSTGTAAGIILLLIVVLAVADRATGFSEKRIDNMKKEKMEFIGKPGIQANDGVMTPEILLSFGKVSDPQVSPDGKTLLYGVSYTSVKDNRSCNNLYLINTDGSGRQQLTRSGKSFSNARWSLDGKQLIYIQDGQIWSAPVKGKEGRKRLGKAVQLSDIPDGISEFKLSPDQSQVMYVSSVQSSLKKPSDLKRLLGMDPLRVTVLRTGTIEAYTRRTGRTVLPVGAPREVVLDILHLQDSLGEGGDVQ